MQPAQDGTTKNVSGPLDGRDTGVPIRTNASYLIVVFHAVPVANLIRLAVDRESGDFVVR